MCSPSFVESLSCIVIICIVKLIVKTWIDSCFAFHGDAADLR